MFPPAIQHLVKWDSSRPENNPHTCYDLVTIISVMTLFTIPTFTRRPSFTLSFAHSPAVGETFREKVDVDAPQPLRKRKVSSISSPKTLVPTNHSKPVTRSQRHPHSPAKRLPRPAVQRVTRSQSRSHLLVPHKSTPTQTLTLTSALSISSQAKDIKDVDINTVSFPSPNQLRTIRSRRSFSRPVSPIPSRSGMMVGSTRSPPPHPGMGRGRGIITTANNSPRAGNHTRVRTLSPPSAGTPHKRARLTSSSRALSRTSASYVSDETQEIPARPGSPTPGSGPVSNTPLPSIATLPDASHDNINTEEDWDSMPPSDATKLVPSSEDDDDDIIVFKMEVEDSTPVALSRPPSPVQQMMDVEEIDRSETPVVPPTPCSSPTFEDSDMLDDPREDMQRQSILLAKRVRKRMNPSLPDDSPPPTPSPIRLRQAIATMFLEQSNAFPPMRRRPSPPGLDGCFGPIRRKSSLGVEVRPAPVVVC